MKSTYYLQTSFVYQSAMVEAKMKDMGLTWIKDCVDFMTDSYTVECTQNQFNILISIV